MQANGTSSHVAVRMDREEVSAKELLGTRAIASALYLLTRARFYAQNVPCDLWQFAVERSVFREVGVSTSDLRWLLRKQFVLHAGEVTGVGDNVRTFAPRGEAVIDDSSCFVLTPLGDQVAVATLSETSSTSGADFFPGASAILGESLVNSSLRPKWDGDRREVRYGGELVKQFKVPSRNQERVLAAFEEEHWPRRIDDPLPPTDDMNSKQRLHDTIRSLNRNQRHSRLRFLGDGTGEGVLWEPYLPR